MSELDYIVQYGEEKIIIKTSNKNEIIKLACKKLKSVDSMTCAANYELEVYHKVHDCYYTPVDDRDIPDGGLLRLTVVVKEEPFVESSESFLNIW